jgi:protein gp37
MAMGSEKYADGFKVIRTHESELLRPFTWRKPTTVFVNSMSDLFHVNVPLPFIKKVFDTMNQCQQHKFQILTKRSELLEDYSSDLTWTNNIWMGVSVEDGRVRHRIEGLRKCGAKTKFLSLEPLLGPLPDLDLTGIHWVIVGGESGRKPRPMKEEWVEDIRKQCEAAGVAFFFKQWGGKNKKAAGRILNGRTYDEMPTGPSSRKEVALAY